MKVLTINALSFLKGISTSNFTKDGGYSLDTESIEVTRKGSNFGLLCAGRSYENNSTNLADYVYSTVLVKRTALKAYSIGSGGRIYETTGFDATLSHTVKATESVKTYDSNSDIIVYGDKLYITSQTDIAYDDFSFSAVDDNWWTGTKSKTALTSGVPHKLFIFQGKLYITDGNKLHEWDGTTATYEKLVLPTGFIINAIEILNNQIYLGCSYTTTGTLDITENRIFVWDGYTTNAWIREIKVSTSTIRAFRELDGLLYFFAGSDLYVCDGFNYRLIRRSIGSPNWGATASLNGKLYFGGDSNTIYTYDPSMKIVEKICKLDLVPLVIFTPYSDHVYAFVQDVGNSKSKMYKCNSNNASSISFYSNYYDFDVPIVIKRIEVFFSSPLTSGASYNVYLFDEVDTEKHNQTISYGNDGAIIKKSYQVNAQLDSFRLKILFGNSANKPIRWIKVYYEPSERTNSK